MFIKGFCGPVSFNHFCSRGIVSLCVKSSLVDIKPQWKTEDVGKNAAELPGAETGD